MLNWFAFNVSEKWGIRANAGHMLLSELRALQLLAV